MRTRGNVLLVDDDSALLEALSNAVSLRLPQTEVHPMASPTSALARLKTQRFSAIISDLRMPDMTGLDLLKNAHALQPETPFILMTGHGDRQLADEAFRAGAFDFIQKPFDRSTFMASLKTAFNASRLRTRIHARQSTLAKLSEFILAHEAKAKRPLAVENIYTVGSRECLKRSIRLSRVSLERIRKRYDVCERVRARDTEILNGMIQNRRRHAEMRLH